MKIRLGMMPPVFHLVFSSTIKRFSFFGGGGKGVLKIKVGGRSRDRTETCIVVLPYREPEGINSFKPWPTNPVADSPFPRWSRLPSPQPIVSLFTVLY